ncbi:spermidine synthase [Butyrivibrio sp. CB08]|uniref:spermidine synthase n=1 Tax=Butyrivibrio sp. CB08 TaxID=2364879 RepID=UPI000EA96999|nr:fused MFS/spermidine synthase [Butyrivibrio sp. CB08]RKM60464.1 spermidine synthase [Butyrivibrio sp. CB08]
MNKKKILRSKLFLYLTEFFAGMSVMAVELGASRLLAPYFSSSQIVWTIIIGTIMIAMALGNIYGGRKADKDPDPAGLYRRILIAAIWIALIPVLGKYIIIGISAVLVFAVNSNFLVIAAFAACMVVFVFPLFLLGTVTPSLAKYTTDSLEDNGRIIGTLGAYNTVGSIIGTFVPTFVTIPAVGTAVTFLIFSGILIVLSILYFVSPYEDGAASAQSGGSANGKKSLAKGDLRRIIAGALIFFLCVIFGHNTSFAFWENDLTFEGESVYNYLQVKETDNSVILSTNVLFGVQSILIKDGALTGMYYDYAMAAPYMAGIKEKEKSGEELNLLILGMGSGTYATQLSRYFDNITVEGVEIDDKITDLAHRYFELPAETKVTTYDGRAYLAAIDGQYDVIMVDAYQDITIPFQMSSVEFFSMVKEHLAPGGVMVVNMNMYSDDQEGINTYLSDTISSVFSDVVTVKVPNSTNRELFATDDPSFMVRLSENVAMEDNETLRAMMQRVLDTYVRYESTGHIMTDDKAPVELLGMRQIDSIIQNEVSYYRHIYETQGIQGLLELL